MISGAAPLTIHFTDTTPPQNETVSKVWDFGDGSAVSIEDNPQHTFSTEGLYEVSLTVSNGISSSTYTDEVLVIPANQSSYWPLDEEIGTRHDEVAGLNLTQNNGVLNAPGMFGRAALFNGTDQYLSRAASGTELYPQGSYTVSMWIYPTGTTTNQHYTFISKSRNSGTDRPFYATWFYRFGAATQLINVFWTGSDNSLMTGTCPVNLVPVNEWTHIAFGYTTSTKLGHTWINGVDISQFLWGGPLTANPATTGTCPFIIGASNIAGAPSNFFQGRIQEARIFDRLLSQAEIDVLAMEIPDAMQTSEERAAQIMLDLSNDGGKTWIAQPWRSIGGAGQWAKRVRWNRLGAARRRVFMVSVTDPVPWKITGAYLDDPNGGSSGR